MHAVHRFSRQYCSRGSNPEKYFLFIYAEIFLLFSERYRILSCNRHMKHLYYIIWKGYLPPFVSALKCIKYLLAGCKRIADCLWKRDIKYPLERAISMWITQIAWNVNNVSSIPLWTNLKFKNGSKFKNYFWHPRF